MLNEFYWFIFKIEAFRRRWMIDCADEVRRIVNRGFNPQQLKSVVSCSGGENIRFNRTIDVQTDSPATPLASVETVETVTINRNYSILVMCLEPCFTNYCNVNTVRE